MMNQEISQVFRDMAKILEIKGDNRFRIRAYERAAQNIESLTEDIQRFAQEDRLREIPGIGVDLADKIKEYLKNGKVRAFQKLKKSIPSGLLDLVNIPSVGPKTARLLYENLNIKNIADLEKAIKRNKLRGIFGIKEKTVANIASGIGLLKKGRERMTLFQAMLVADAFMQNLKSLNEAECISEAGSLRRLKETVRDIDILVASDNPQKIMDRFVSLPPVKKVIAKGATKSSVLTRENVQVDCRVVEKKSFGAALVYFTGSKNFNIKLRQLALRKGLKVNEYGIFRGDKFVSGRTEVEVFKTLGLSFIAPELREDSGEIELAKENALPQLLQLKDTRGHLHVHSQWSDGHNSIEEMARACMKRGYAYAAITDHSQGLKVAGGLSIAELKKKKQEIDRLNNKLKNFRILFGGEVDIDANGELDYPDEVLKGFDLVVAAIHSGFKQSRAQLTKRITRACKNKDVHIIAHPTGRLWGTRDAYEIDFEEILKVAKDTNTHLEINSFPQRLDLNDLHARAANEKGIKLAANTDAHATEQLDFMQLGVAVARRGWLTASCVVNTLPLEGLLKELKK
jgi:DNA polymerase (family 10)